jgi:hypothetical protein
MGMSLSKVLAVLDETEMRENAASDSTKRLREEEEEEEEAILPNPKRQKTRLSVISTTTFIRKDNKLPYNVSTTNFADEIQPMTSHSANIQRACEFEPASIMSDEQNRLHNQNDASINPHGFSAQQLILNESEIITKKPPKGNIHILKTSVRSPSSSPEPTVRISHKDSKTYRQTGSQSRSNSRENTVRISRKSSNTTAHQMETRSRSRSKSRENNIRTSRNTQVSHQMETRSRSRSKSVDLNTKVISKLTKKNSLPQYLQSDSENEYSSSETIQTTQINVKNLRQNNLHRLVPLNLLNKQTNTLQILIKILIQTIRRSHSPKSVQMALLLKNRKMVDMAQEDHTRRHF